MNYALDTNIIIRYLRGEATVGQNLDDALVQKFKLYVPRVVDYEIRRGFDVMPVPSLRKESAYKLLVQRCTVSIMDEVSWERAIKIYSEQRKKGFTVGELDILIGALCLVHGYVLVTNNTKHFQNISGLNLVDWTQTQGVTTI